MNIKKFIQECSRRNVFKLLSIYVVSSWVILQVLAVVAEPLALPEKSISFLIVALIIGFPIYVIYIWRIKLSKSWESDEDDTTQELLAKSKFRQLYFTSTGIILFLAGLSVTFIFNNAISTNINLPKIASNDKIAVLEFDNLTSIDSLNGIGEMAAYWISHGITENDAGQIISKDLVRDYSDAMKTQNKVLTSNEILTKFFNPGKRVIGTYFKDGSELIFKSSIVDGVNGKVLISFEQVVCDEISPLKCIEDLQQEIVGYLVDQSRGSLSLEIDPPKYEAFKALLEAQAYDREGNKEKYLEYLNKSITIDSNYFEPKSLRIGYYYNYGPYETADSLIDNIRQTTGISKRQQMLINLYRAALDGDNRKVYLYNDYDYQIAPADLNTNLSHMIIALQFVNKPEDVEAIFKVENFDELGIENCRQCVDRIHIMSMAYNELGQYNKAIELLEPYLEIVDERFFLMPIFRSYININNHEKVDELLSRLRLRISSKDWLYINLFIARQYLIKGNNDKAATYLNTIIYTNITDETKFIVAEAYSELKTFKKAAPLYASIYNEDPEDVKAIVGLSKCYFRDGKIKESDALITKLNELRTPYQYGEIDYRIAQIYADRGEEDIVFEHLLMSIAAGNFYINETFKNSSSFIPYLQSEKWNEIMTYWH